jgi:hypothetical protein
MSFLLEAGEEILTVINKINVDTIVKYTLNGINIEDVNINNGVVSISNARALRFGDSFGHYISITAPINSSSYTIIWPTSLGTEGQVLQLQSSGQLVWSNKGDIIGDINLSGDATINFNGTNGKSISIGAPPNITTSYDIILPPSGPTQDSQVLKTIGTTGTLIWANQNELKNSLILSDTNGNDFTIKLPVPMTGDLNITLPNNSGTIGNFLILNDTTTGQLIWGDHGNIAGLGDDDHLQYALLAGRIGGQTLIGGLNMTENLILRSTSNSTKGEIISDSNIRLGVIGGVGKDLLLQENDGGSSYVGLRGPESMSTSYRLAFPDNRGTIGQILGINGTSGSDISTLSWFDRNIYGQLSEHYYIENKTLDGKLFNVGTPPYTTRLSLITNVLPIGAYKITWYYQWAYTHVSSHFMARIVLDNDTTEVNLIMDQQDFPARATPYGEASGINFQKSIASGFNITTFNTNASHSLTLEWKPEIISQTAYISKARMELHRVF